MNTSPPFVLLYGLTLTLLLAALSVFLSRSSAYPKDGPNRLTRFFLVALRLSIGWHFLVEGIDKLSSASWTSEPYLREATGPLAPYFRELAGDRLVAKLTPTSNHSFPPELDVEWRAYLEQVISFYELNGEQTKKANEVLENAETKTLNWLETSSKPVQKIAEYPPPLTVSMTIPQRLDEYKKLARKVQEVEEVYLPKYGDDAFGMLKTAKGNLNKWRGELKSDLDKQTAEFKLAVRDQVLVDIAKNALPQEYRDKVSKATPLPDLLATYHKVLLKKVSSEEVPLTPQAAKVFEYVIDKKKDKQDPVELLPPPRMGFMRLARPVSSWEWIDWSDFLVKWGITLTGAFLLLGLLTRTSCVAGAGLLLMFFLAMPPLPGLPESPRSEGHYLFINKNIIEMLALLTLATTRSGRWAGLDGLFQFCCPRRWKKTPPSSNLETGPRTV